MRLPTNRDWVRLIKLTNGENNKIHWGKMFFWLERIPEHGSLQSCRDITGYLSSTLCSYSSIAGRSEHLGFRPVVDISSSGRYARLKEGKPAVMGTMYMDGEPVRTPENPVYGGDVARYVPGAKLELREPLDDPAYQVIGIRAGNALVADRCLLSNISYKDIIEAI